MKTRSDEADAVRNAWVGILGMALALFFIAELSPRTPSPAAGRAAPGQAVAPSASRREEEDPEPDQQPAAARPPRSPGKRSSRRRAAARAGGIRRSPGPGQTAKSGAIYSLPQAASCGAWFKSARTTPRDLRTSTRTTTSADEPGSGVEVSSSRDAIPRIACFSNSAIIIAPARHLKLKMPDLRPTRRRPRRGGRVVVATTKRQRRVRQRRASTPARSTLR